MIALRKILLFVFIFIGGLAAAQQDVRISGEYKSKSITHVLRDWEEKFFMNFAFDTYELSKIKDDWSFDNVEVNEALHLLLDQYNLDFKWSESTVIIFPIQKMTMPEAINDKMKVQILGEVRDFNTKELLPFAVLAPRKWNSSVSCNAEGKFFIEDDLLADDTIDVFFVGYEVRSITVAEFRKNASTLILLYPAKNYLPDVMISAAVRPPMEPSSNSSSMLLNPNEILTRHGIGEADVFRTSQILPGVSSTLESNNGLFIRGSDSDQSLISLDGFTIYHLDHLFGTFSSVNANAVKVMRLNKGATDAKFGGRIAGMLEMVGKEGNLNRPSIQIDLGTMSVGAAVETPTDTLGKSSFFFCARRSITDALFSPAYKKLFNTIYSAATYSNESNQIETFGGLNEPDFFFQDANLKFTFRPSIKDVLNFSLYTSSDNLYVQYADTSNNEATNVEDIVYSDESVKKNTGVSARWIHKISNRWEALTSVGLSIFDGDFFSTDTIQKLLFQTTEIAFSSENTSLRDFNGRFDLTGQYRRNILNFGYQINAIQTDNKRNSQGEIFDDPSEQANVHSIYFQDNWTVFSDLKISPGLRINYFNRQKQFSTEPRMLAVYEPTQRLGFRLSAGIANQFIQRVQTQNLYLNTPDYWRLAGDSGLNVLRSIQISSGAAVKLQYLTIDVEAYYRKSDGNSFMPGLYASYLDNSQSNDRIISGITEAKGVEAMLTSDFGKNHFLLSYSIMKTSASYVELEQEKMPEVFDQLHELKFSYEFKWKKLRFGALWIYGSGRPYTPLLGFYTYALPNGNSRSMPVFGDLNSARLPEYHRLDINAAYQFMMGKTKLNVVASIYNVYNRQNIRDIQYNILRNGASQDDYTIGTRSLQMIGFLPTLNLQFLF